MSVASQTRSVVVLFCCLLASASLAQDTSADELGNSENSVKVQMERLRAERVYNENEEKIYNNLTPDARATTLAKEFNVAFEATATWQLRSHDEFLPRALSNLRVAIDGDRAVVRTARDKVIARVAVGDTVPVEHPDVSAIHLEVTKVDGIAKTIDLKIADTVYTLHDDGTVEPPSAEKLRAEFRKFVAAFNKEEDAQTFAAAYQPSVVKMFELFKSKTKRPLSLSRLVTEMPLEYRVLGRPFEFALSLFCIARGEVDGRAMVWEKINDGYFLRPFPLGENIFEQDLHALKVSAIKDDSSEATLRIAGAEGTIQPLDFVMIPMGGKSYVDGMVESIDAKWHEVMINAAGRCLVLATLPEEIARKPITAKSREVRVRMLCSYLSSLGGLKVTPGTVINRTAKFEAVDRPFVDLLDQLCGENEWRYRWISQWEILMDYPEFLIGKDIDSKRASGN